MNSYTFYTINTVIDIGDGKTPPIENNKFTGAMNLSRLLESIMVYGHPMMVSINKLEVDLSKNNNSTFYNLPEQWGNCVVSTFKFTLPVDVDIIIDGIPLVVPCIVNNTRLTKFNTLNIQNTQNTQSACNISITKQTF